LSGPRPVVVLFGPTAVGKTAVLEGVFSGALPVEIISADSMQVYRHMDIGTAKPPAALLQRLPHHLIDVVDPDYQFNAGEFVHRAEALVEAIAGRGRWPVLCGGCAYYLRSFINGLPDSPPGDAAVRRELREELRDQGLPALQEKLAQVDPEAAAAIQRRDSHRILRALEVYRVTGRPLSSFRNPAEARKQYLFLLIGLQREREELYRRIAARVQGMFEQGLADEVRRLLAMGYGDTDPGMRGIGYREFGELRRGCLTLAEVRGRIEANSRRYAKRQITFFRSLPGVQWVHADDGGRVRDLVESFAGASPGPPAFGAQRSVQSP
jgi:tRNA dimethylallyltransferase